MLLISALTGQRALNVLERVDEVYASAGLRIRTTELNRWLEQAAATQTRAGKRAFRVYYVTQTGVHPPRFVIFCNDPNKAHFSVRRYLENSLRDRFDFGAAPIRLQFRGRRGEQR